MRNVLLVNRDASLGGAAQACQRLRRGLLKIGYTANLLARDADPGNGDVASDDSNRALWKKHERFGKLLRMEAVDRRVAWHFSAMAPSRTIASHPLVQAAEVINLHWVADFITPRNVAELLDAGKPVVWTLHDQGPLTGGCHYAGNCRRFESLCRECPQLRPEFRSLAVSAHEASIALLSGRANLSIVAPSRWLAAEVQRSAVFADLRVECIPNEVDLDVFHPAPGKDLRKRLGWSERALVVIFGGHYLDDRRKGFDLVLSALAKCLQDEEIARKVRRRELIFAAFGNGGAALEDFDLPIYDLGLKQTEEEMAEVYQSADVFVCASRADNLPNTIMEAMGCALPVLASAVGGIPEMVHHGVNGRLFPPNDAMALAVALCEVVRDPSPLSAMGGQSRAICERNYAQGTQALAYAGLFEDILRTSREGQLKSNRPENDLAWQYAEREAALVEAELIRRAGGVRPRLIRKLRELRNDSMAWFGRKVGEPRTWAGFGGAAR